MLRKSWARLLGGLKPKLPVGRVLWLLGAACLSIFPVVVDWRTTREIKTQSPPLGATMSSASVLRYPECLPVTAICKTSIYFPVVPGPILIKNTQILSLLLDFPALSNFHLIENCPNSLSGFPTTTVFEEVSSTDLQPLS